MPPSQKVTFTEITTANAYADAAIWEKPDLRVCTLVISNTGDTNDASVTGEADTRSYGAFAFPDTDAEARFGTYDATASVGKDAVVKSTGEITVATVSDAEVRMDGKAIAGSIAGTFLEIDG